MRMGSVVVAMLMFFPLAAAVQAQVPQESETTFFVKGASRAAVPMAAWASGGKILGAHGDAAKKAPRKAVRYEAKMVAWPTATVKVLSFTKAGGGVLHPITNETTVYVQQGSVKATVAGKDVTLGAGDLASLPSGALRNVGKPGDAVVIAWTAASLVNGATPAVVRLADLPAPKPGDLTIRRYDFPGNSVRAVTMKQGFKTSPNSAKTDSLIVASGGPMRFLQDGQEFVVESGDFLREVAGLKHNWDVTEAAGFVTTSALPIGAAPINPDEATDRPK